MGLGTGCNDAVDAEIRDPGRPDRNFTLPCSLQRASMDARPIAQWDNPEVVSREHARCGGGFGCPGSLPVIRQECGIDRLRSGWQCPARQISVPMTQQETGT